MHFLLPITRRPWILVLCLLASIAGGAAYLWKVTPKYQSSTQILVMKREANLTADAGAAGLEASLGSEVLGTHLQIISSPRIVRDAVEEHDLLALDSLRQQLENPAGLVANVKSWIPREVKQLTEQQQRDAAVNYILNNLRVRRGGSDAARDAQVVSVRFEHYSSAEDCAAILSAVIDCYRDFLQGLSERLGEETKLAMTQAKERLESDVQFREEQRDAFLIGSPLIWSNGAAMNPHQSHAAKLEIELSDLEIERASIAARLEGVRAALSDETEDSMALFALVDPADVERLSVLLNIERGYLPASAATEFSKLLELKVELKRKEAVYAPTHPQVRQLRKTVEELEGYLESNSRSLESLRDDDGIDPRRIAEVYQRQLEEDLSEVNGQIAVVSRLTDQQLDKAKSLSAYELQYDRLTRKLDRTQDLYDRVVDRLRVVDIDGGGFLTEDISPIGGQGIKIAPRLPFVGALSLLCGLFLGGALSLLAEWTDTSFRSKFDMESNLEAPLLGQIGIAHFRQPPKAGRRNRKPGTAHESLAVLHFPGTPFAESFRGLRAAISCRSNSAQQPVLQVTSPIAGDGKSTVTANLALTLANAGKKVLLVDCDLRNPSVHTLFGFSNKIGLTSYLLGSSKEIAMQGPVQNLSIITSGPLTAQCSEMLSTASFEKFLATVRDDYDIVLLDSPPVFGASDSLAISNQADGSILVVRVARRNARHLARRAKDELVGHGGRIFGIVANGELAESLTDEYPHYGSALRVVAMDGVGERELSEVSVRHAK